MKIRENLPISQLTTMRLGGAARYVVDITGDDDVEQAYKLAKRDGLPVYILGGGSNVIARDEGFNGLILLNRLTGYSVVKKTTTSMTLRIKSGEILDNICENTAKKGYTGMEALSAIPGTVGGAVIQNSGAYGQEIADILESVEVFDSHKKAFLALAKADLEYSYRRSIFNTTAKGRYFITAVCLKLKKGEMRGEFYASLQRYLDDNGILDRSPLTIRRAVCDIRADKLPDPKIIPSAGSFFKNITIPPEEVKKYRADFPEMPIYKIGKNWEIASGWLIEQAGLKGQTLHGIKVSDRAALILINQSAQSYADLAAARAEIIQTVQQKFGLALEQEPEELSV
ncbi:MAG: UDP-N-acetylmuramate dehydrogenase [Candidatus Nomurabacteria bacterium]|jgi:UDP-N-acetylmuramate dehydrogenase|nr:UDP-N-acetylmuramate dehydrogenase [Candidatus Nomurabacteria bacterium]